MVKDIRTIAIDFIKTLQVRNSAEELFGFYRK